MRVLFTTPGGWGHIHPTVPLARAMVERGHELVWAVPARSVEQVERAGFDAAPASDAPPAGPHEVVAAYPELLEHPPDERPDYMFGKLFGAIVAPPMLKGLAPLAVEWRPDLVVADAAELAAPIVAAEVGVPCVTKGFGPLLPAVRYARAAEEVAPLWRSRGLEPRPYCGMFDHLYLDIYPPALHDTGGVHVQRRQALRPIAYDGSPDGSVPLPHGGADSPLVYVTMGTVFNDAGPLRAAVGAIASLEARVLVTVGPFADPDVLGPQPDHVRVEQYVPQTALLPHCAAVVSHAGSGTVLATLALGLPQLCLPQGADQFLNASAVAAAGAGISIPPDRATPEAIADAVGRLLGEPMYGIAAKEVAASIDDMPSPEEVAGVLEGLV